VIPLRFNADYESVLFHGKPSSVINEALEFLLFYLDEGPVLTRKKYEPEFLSSVEAMTGRQPELISNSHSLNWWGPLEDIFKEKMLNSKLTTSYLNQKQKWAECYILPDQLMQVKWDKEYVIKDPFGMSGQGFRKAHTAQDLPSGQLILEPLLKRKNDFSHFVFEDNTSIAYENIVDERFQYRGTIFQNHFESTIENLSFYHEVKDWSEFRIALPVIINHMRSLGAQGGFSIDSFTYLQDDQQKIRILSEVNYRKTMGLLAYLLSKKLSPNHPWTLFTLEKNKVNLQDLDSVLCLSPSGVRFQIYLLRAKNSEDGQALYQEFKARIN